MAATTSAYDSADPMGKMLFILATVAEFEADQIRLRICEGVVIARANGKVRGR
jgi:DNA invertase Pin-like site-specific DNA recombinase